MQEQIIPFRLLLRAGQARRGGNSINLGTVEQTLQFTAPTAASADTITVSLTDHNNNVFRGYRRVHSADSARTVACEFVSAANALFAAQGVSYNAFETSAGE